jgi:hypothetical protein
LHGCGSFDSLAQAGRSERGPVPSQRDGFMSARDAGSSSRMFSPRNSASLSSVVASPRNSRLTPPRGSGRKDMVPSTPTQDTVISQRDGVISPPEYAAAESHRKGAQNGYVVHPSFVSSPTKGFQGNATLPNSSIPSPLSPRYHHQAAGVSPQFSSPDTARAKGAHPFRPLSQTFDASHYQEQTVTFV